MLRRGWRGSTQKDIRRPRRRSRCNGRGGSHRSRTHGSWIANLHRGHGSNSNCNWWRHGYHHALGIFGSQHSAYIWNSRFHLLKRSVHFDRGRLPDFSTCTGRCIFITSRISTTPTVSVCRREWHHPAFCPSSAATTCCIIVNERKPFNSHSKSSSSPQKREGEIR